MSTDSLLSSPPAEVADRAEHRLEVMLFTDLLNSSGLKVELGDMAYATDVARPHNELFRATLARYPGAREISYTGDGFFASFRSVCDAVEVALLFHHALRVHPWRSGEVRTRIGIHLGEVVVLSDGGEDLNFASHAADMCARLMSLGGGGQTLLTRHAFDDARQYVRAHPPLPEGGEPPLLQWAAHGPYLFKGKDESLEVFEVGAVGFAPLSPPPDAEKARRAIRAGDEETLGWRPAQGIAIPGRPGWLLKKKIGEGGFGEVWLAEQARLRQRRVFKFCFDEERLRSFKRELTFFRLLRDALGERDDIARLYDVKLDAPPFFLESEFAEHGNLVEWCEREGGVAKIPLERRLELLARVAEAVAAAHSIGVLHKDLKPQNVLMQSRPGGEAQPQLTDFGIGALADRSALDAHSITAAGFTIMTLLGDKSSGSSMTRLYASPEQLTGKPYTVQGDIYALGVVLYQLIIGDFSRALAPGWERDVQDDLLREDLAECVDGDSTRRFSSAAELAERLRSLETRRSQLEASRRRAEQSARRKRVVRFSVALGGLSLVAAVALGYGLFRERMLYRRLKEAEVRHREEEAQRLADRHRFAPALVEAARVLVAHGDLPSARLSVEQAVEYNPELTAARALQAALLAERQDFASAVEALDHAGKLDETQISLRELSRTASVGKPPPPKEMGSLFQALGLPKLAETYFKRAGAKAEAGLAAIDVAWPGAAALSKVLPSGRLEIELSERTDVHDLSALHDLPIESLHLDRTAVDDLNALKGLPLNKLSVSHTAVSDLTPLSGLPLTVLVAGHCERLTDISAIVHLPLEHLDISFTGIRVLPALAGVRLRSIDLSGTAITDLLMLKGAPLESLHAPKTAITDLSPIAAAPLSSLDICATKITDITPVRACPLSSVYMADTEVTDISVLAGKPLQFLDISRTHVADVTPVAGAPLQLFIFTPEQITTGLDKLRANDQIEKIRGRANQTLPRVEFWKYFDAGYFGAF